MNVNPILKSCLSPFGSIPVKAGFYTGDAEEYITFNYSDERPALFADDVDVFDETVVQVHLFTRSDPQEYKKKLRRCLRSGGFSIQSTYEVFEKDTKFNHITVTISIGGAVNDEEDNNG